MPTVRNERGIALAVAVFAMVVIGALVAGAFYVGRQEQRIGRNTVFMQQALTAAEEGAYMTIANWDPRQHNEVDDHPIDSVTGPDCTVQASGEYCASVRRLDELLFLIESEGFSPQRFARQRVGVLARLRPIELSINAALETQQITTLGGNQKISGVDSEGDWSSDPALCGPPVADLPGIRIKDASTIVTEGNNWEVNGDNPQNNGLGAIEEDPTITGDGLTTFGDADWEVLRSMATMVLAPAELPAIAGGQIRPVGDATTCNTAVTGSWGEPALSTTAVPNNAPFVAGCQNYFPVVYVTGDAQITNARGQGVLIVEGDLYVTGGFEFYGPVIVQGALVTEGGPANDPAHFYGGVIAARVSSGGVDNRLAGNAELYYSSCAITRALQGGAKPWPLQERSWVNMY
jgi:hypothetical protein